MNLEQVYADLWKASAKAEGHRSRMPKGEPVTPRTEPQLRQDILKVLDHEGKRIDEVRAKVNAKKTTVQNNLYQMRSAGMVHSIFAGPKVIWRLGPKPQEQAA